MSTPTLFPQSTNGKDAFNKVEWLQDVAALLEPEARERFLLRVATFQQVNPRDPLFVKAYEEATRKRFGEVLDGTVQPAITKSTTLITNRLQSWAEGLLDQQLTKMSSAVTATLTSVTRDCRVRLYGTWSGLLWAMLAGGVIAGLVLFMAGYYLGKH